MAFDISSLSSFKYAGSGYSVKTATKSPTFKMLLDSANASFGVKGTEKIRKISYNIALQDNDGCSRTNASTVILADKDITCYPLKAETAFCTRALWNTYFATSLSQGLTPHEEFTPEFANVVMDGFAAETASKLEIELWQGVRGSTATTYNHITGIIKQATDGSAVTATTSGNTVVKLQMIYDAADATESAQEDFVIFISDNTAKKYAIDAANANLFNPAQPDVLYGTNIRLVRTPGLNGTGKAYATRLSNLQVATDGVSDIDASELFYDQVGKNMLAAIEMGAGIAIIRPELVTVGAS